MEKTWKSIGKPTEIHWKPWKIQGKPKENPGFSIREGYATTALADGDLPLGKTNSIGKPKGNIEVADYVLQNFDEDETIGIEKVSKNITDSISILVEKKLDLFSSTVNNK